MTFCILDTNCTVFDRQSRLPGLSYSSPVCQGCRDRTRAELNLLRYDYIDLSQLIPKADGRGEAKIFRPKPESAPPVNMAVLALRGEIAYFVGLVAIVLRQHIGSPQQPALPVREGYALDRDVRWLQEHVDGLAGLGGTRHYWRANELVLEALSGPELILEFGTLHRRARRLCGLDERTITVPGHCPDCQTPSLRRHADDPEKIWCLHCKKTMSAPEYAQAVRLQIPHPRHPSS